MKWSGVLTSRYRSEPYCRHRPWLTAYGIGRLCQMSDPASTTQNGTKLAQMCSCQVISATIVVRTSHCFAVSHRVVSPKVPYLVDRLCLANNHHGPYSSYRRWYLHVVLQGIPKPNHTSKKVNILARSRQATLHIIR